MKNRISRACAGHWILRAIWLLLMIGIGVLGQTGMRIRAIAIFAAFLGRESRSAVFIAVAAMLPSMAWPDGIVSSQAHRYRDDRWGMAGPDAVSTADAAVAYYAAHSGVCSVNGERTQYRRTDLWLTGGYLNGLPTYAFDLQGWACPDNYQSGWVYLMTVGIYPEFVSTCPANSALQSSESCVCNPSYAPNGSAATACVATVETDLTRMSPQRCEVSPNYGNPIYPNTGTKRESVDLGFGVGRARATLTYDTTRHVPLVVSGTDLATTELASFGELWLSSLHRRLVIGAGNKGARVARGDGRIVSFIGNGSGVYTADASTNDRLTSVSGGYSYVDVAAGSLESYNSAGQLTRVDRADGQALTFSYSTSSTPTSVAPGTGYLLQVQDAFARTVGFEYSGAGRVSRITDPAGQVITAAYDAAGNLSQLTWPDAKVRTFLYENTSLPWALTGVIDERGVRTSTFGYDAQGRAISTERAGGVDRYSVSYASPPAVLVSDVFDSAANVVLRTRSWQAPTAPVITTPNGSTLELGVALVANNPSVTSRSQPAGSGCAASTSSQSYDANGNVASRDDFNGQRTCYANDLSRNLETARVEGLANTASCTSVMAQGASLPAGSRKVSTAWHPDWRLETKVAEPGRMTTSVYNGQPDPFNGNAIASCAPSSALLPDGKPIVVLCKKVEQATSDANGSQGLSASLQSGVAARQWQWTYNQHGQVLTEDGPRTDVVDVTTYAYYADTTAEHTMGDLHTVTDALGRTTTYAKYNRHGQVLEMSDANGVVTTNTYDLRQRLTGTTVAGQTTAYTYDPVGQLTRLTRPDGSWMGWEYDDAHRQVAVTDNRGNRIDYVLDNAGHRTGEQVKDPTGALRRQLSRSFDALGRVQTVSGAQ